MRSGPGSDGIRPSDPSGWTTASTRTRRAKRSSAISSFRWARRSSQEEQGMSGRFKDATVVGAALAGLVALAWVLTPALAQAPQAPAATRIGYVDLQRILARSQAGVQAREQIEKDKASMQKQVDGQKTDYDKLRDELEKKGQLLSADARREKQEALERKTRDIRRLLDDLEKELQKKEQIMGQKILRDLEGIFARVG